MQEIKFSQPEVFPMTGFTIEEFSQPPGTVRVVLPDVSECSYPESKRTMFITPNGEILVAAALFGMDSEKFLLKSMEKVVQCIMHNKCLYFTTTWITEQKPVFRRICAQLEQKARESLAKGLSKRTSSGE